MIGGKYRVEGTLGAGGMGTVVAARHVELGQEVAVKLLHPQALEQPGAIARFLREARTAVALHGEHVARILDVGTLSSGAPYIVMERLRGRDLSDVLVDGPISIADAAHYVIQACDAMAEAHALGIVHRDLKPSNLFLCERPNRAPMVKVLDFGISKVEPAGRQSTSPSLTATGALMGSPLYMSPEQVRSSKQLDGRSDIWSLGVILYELCTGQHPFTGESASAILAAIAADPPTPLREHLPDAPPELEQVLSRCLAKDKTERYPTIDDLVSELEPLAEGASGRTDRRGATLLRVPRSRPVDDERTLAVTEAASAQRIGDDRREKSPTGSAWVGSTQSRRRRRRVWTIVGGIALAAGVTAIASTRIRASSGTSPESPPGPVTSVVISAPAPPPALDDSTVVVTPAPSEAPTASARAGTTVAPSAAALPPPSTARRAPPAPGSPPKPTAAATATPEAPPAKTAEPPKAAARDPLLDRK